MKNLPLTDGPVQFAGALSLEITEQGVQPWRLDFERIDFFEPGLRGKAIAPAGVRINLISDTSSLVVDLDSPFREGEEDVYFPREPWSLDLLVDGIMHQRITQPPEDFGTQLQFINIPSGEHRLELYVDHVQPVRIKKIQIDDQATAKPFEDTRPKWLAYGSSITHGRQADGPSEVWPVLVANQLGLNLTSMGYGGNCHLEPMVTRLIRDRDVDFISTCVGINVQGGLSYSPRTFRAAVIGMIQTIREGHPTTPLMVVSPICSPPLETEANNVGLSLCVMRENILEAVQIFEKYGDKNIYYHDGLKLFGPEQVHTMPDEVHPDPQGIHLLAQRYAEQVMPRLMG